MESLEYKPALSEVVDRHRLLWSGQLPNGILARVDPMELPFDDPLSHCPDIPAMAAAWDHNYRVRRGVEDDLLPVARVSFGSAAYGGYLGAEVIFSNGAGWSRPFLADYSQVAQLRFDERNDWIQRQQEACRHFVQIAQDKFAVCENEQMDGLNLAELLRGSAIYTDLYDYPRELHRLLDFASHFNIRLTELQRDLLDPCLIYQEGIFSIFRVWLPGRTVWVSIDAYGLCSPETFREFGAPYLQQVMDHFGGGWIHIHSTDIRLLPEVVKLSGIVGIGILDDLDAPRGFDLLTEIRRVTGDIPLQIDCRFEELEQGLTKRNLPGGVMYMAKQGVETVAQANRLMEKVRTYRASG
ncbi:MAG: hypothetical protein GY762_04850 [Proteobacteria bacterium]|nr:hypothetical protein [Pseudomonadota bacterium]